MPDYVCASSRVRPGVAAADHENDGHCVAIGVRKRQRRAEPALVLCPLGDRSAQTKQRQRTVPCYLDLAQGKGPVGFCECLDHCFLGREPGRQSLHPVVTLAVVDFARGKNLAQVAVPERRQRVLDVVDGHDVASDADAVPVNLARQGDHALTVIVALLRESTDVLLPSGTWHHASDLTRLSTTCPMLWMEAKVDFLSTSSGNSMSNSSSS